MDTLETPVLTVRCGLGRFELLEEGAIRQLDHEGRIVGVYSAKQAPALHAWIRLDNGCGGDKHSGPFKMSE